MASLALAWDVLTAESPQALENLLQGLVPRPVEDQREPTHRRSLYGFVANAADHRSGSLLMLSSVERACKAAWQIPELLEAGVLNSANAPTLLRNLAASVLLFETKDVADIRMKDLAHGALDALITEDPRFAPEPEEAAMLPAKAGHAAALAAAVADMAARDERILKAFVGGAAIPQLTTVEIRANAIVRRVLVRWIALAVTTPALRDTACVVFRAAFAAWAHAAGVLVDGLQNNRAPAERAVQALRSSSLMQVSTPFCLLAVGNSNLAWAAPLLPVLAAFFAYAATLTELVPEAKASLRGFVEDNVFRMSLQASISVAAHTVCTPVTPRVDAVQWARIVARFVGHVAACVVASSLVSDEEEGMDPWLRLAPFRAGSIPTAAPVQWDAQLRAAFDGVGPALAQLRPLPEVVAADPVAADERRNFDAALTALKGGAAKALYKWLAAKRAPTNRMFKADDKLELPALLAIVCVSGLAAHAAALGTELKADENANVQPSPLLLRAWQYVCTDLRMWAHTTKNSMANVEAGAGGDADGGAEETKTAATGAAAGGPDEAPGTPDVADGSGSQRKRRAMRQIVLQPSNTWDVVREQMINRCKLMYGLPLPAPAAPAEWSALQAASVQARAVAARERSPLLNHFAWMAIQRENPAIVAGTAPEIEEAFHFACQSAMLYIREGWAAHADAMTQCLAQRNARAAQRVFGLRALHWLCDFASRMSPVLFSDLMLGLPDALRADTEYDMTAPRSTADDIRANADKVHHWLKWLSGCAPVLAESVQLHAQALGRAIIHSFSTALRDGHLQLVRVLGAFFLSNFTPRDVSAILVPQHVVPALQQQLRLRNMVSLQTATLQDAFPAALAGTSGLGVAWQAWRLNQVAYMLQEGLLSKVEVIFHAQAGNGANSSNRLTPGLAGEAIDVASRLSIEEVVAEYKTFAHRLASDRDTAAALEPTRDSVDVLQRVQFVRRNGIEYCRALLHLWAVRCAQTAQVPDCWNTLQQVLAELLEDLELVLGHNEAVRAGTDANRVALEPQMLEAHARWCLSMIASLLPSEPVVHFLGARVRTLLRVLVSGSFRMRRLALVILRDVLPHVHPVNDAPALGLPDAGNGVAPLLAFLLSLVTNTTCPAGIARRVGVPNPAAWVEPAGFGSGDVQLGLAAQTVAVLRLLQRHPDKKWLAATNQAFRSAVEAVDVLQRSHAEDEKEETRSRYSFAAGILWVLGGGREVFRPGAHVRLRQQATGRRAVSNPFESLADGAMINQALASALTTAGAEGVLIRATRDNAFVLFGEVGVAEVQQVPLATLIPVDEVAPSLVGIALTAPRVVQFLVQQETQFGQIAVPLMMWRVELKARALAALQLFLQNGDCARYAVQADLLPGLFKVALTPVSFSSFLSLSDAEERWSFTIARLLELQNGVMFTSEYDPVTAREAERITNTAQLPRPRPVPGLWEGATDLNLACNIVAADNVAAVLDGVSAEARDLMEEANDHTSLVFSTATGDYAAAFDGTMDNATRFVAGMLVLVLLKPTDGTRHEPRPSKVDTCLGLQIGSVIQPADTGVFVRILSTGSGMGDIVFAPLDQVRRLDALYSFPVSGGSSSLRTLTATTASAVSSLLARRCALTLLLSWPSDVPLTLRTIGGVRNLLLLGRLVSAGEAVLEDYRDDDTSGRLCTISPLQQGLCARFMWLISKEGEARSWAGMTWKCAVCTLVNQGESEGCIVCGSPRPAMAQDTERLSQSLLAECVGGLASSVVPARGDPQYRDSPHPIPAGRNFDGYFQIDNATALVVNLERVEISATTALRFWADPAHTELIASVAVNQPTPPFVSRSNRIWFTCSPGDATPTWGFRMSVMPLRTLCWFAELPVLTVPSLEWACWLTEFLSRTALRHLPTGAIHNSRVVTLLVKFLRTPGLPLKNRALRLLSLLLQTAHNFTAADPVPLPLLQPLETQALTDYQRFKERGLVFLPRRLQQFMELLGLCRVVRRLGSLPLQAFTFREPNNSTAPLQPPVVVPRLLKDWPFEELLVDTFELANSLARRTRVSDRLMCICLLDALGKPLDQASEAGAVSAAVRINASFTTVMDQQLLTFATMCARNASSTMFDLKPSQLTVVEPDTPTSLSGRPLSELRIRFSFISMFNKRLQKCVECLDMGSTEDWSIAQQLRTLSMYIFPDTKTALFETAIEKTWAPNEARCSHVVLENGPAMDSRDRGITDPSASRCIFVQLFEQVTAQTVGQPHALRCKLDEKKRLFRVYYRGLDGQVEEGIDWGGMYRDTMERAVKDLFSDHFTLFLRTPNRNQHGRPNANAFLPNAQHCTPTTLNMFEFVGKLMGISFRQGSNWPFDLAPIVWKLLVDETVTLQDLEDVDYNTAVVIRSVRDMTEDGGVEHTYTIETADGRTVELVPGGAGIPVKYADREEFVNLALQLRLHEWDAQIERIRKGFCSIIPARVLQLCSSRELEFRVCGSAEIDVAQLKRTTAYYGGYSSTSRAVVNFWAAVESMTPEEVSALVKFAWGQARLPRGKNAEQFKLQPKAGGDSALPFGHACFFLIELPEYSTPEIAKRCLVNAVTFSEGAFGIA